MFINQFRDRVIMLTVYRIFFPLVFLFFIPGLVWKLIRRGGWKKTYLERFGCFSRARRGELSGWQGAIWIHAVSVGETNVALTLLNAWNAENPGRRYVLSTTTTTAQEIARNKAPANVKVIFCPVDSFLAIRSVMNLLKPSGLVILETELWPDLVLSAKKRGIPLALVNSRISDRSFGGYRRWRMFFAPVLTAFDRICAQTQLDADRLLEIAPGLKDAVSVCGNIKFDQTPKVGTGFDFSTIFGRKATVVLGASTHSPEELLILNAYRGIHEKYPDTALVIVPRHAERGGEIEKQILAAGFTCFRRSTSSGTEHPDVLLADTTGELAGFIMGADLILMGKTMAGNDEGQNIIEPASMGKPIICGPKLKNFRQALEVLVRADAVRRIQDDSELPQAMDALLADPESRFALGERARAVMQGNRGALNRIVREMENLFRP